MSDGFKFKVDDKHLETGQATLTGAQIKAQAQVDPAFGLFLEVPGDARPDKPISDADVVDLSEPGIEKFYTVPPANFGLL